MDEITQVSQGGQVPSQEPQGMMPTAGPVQSSAPVSPGAQIPTTAPQTAPLLSSPSGAPVSGGGSKKKLWIGVGSAVAALVIVFFVGQSFLNKGALGELPCFFGCNKPTPVADTEEEESQKEAGTADRKAPAANMVRDPAEEERERREEESNRRRTEIEATSPDARIDESERDLSTTSGSPAPTPPPSGGRGSSFASGGLDGNQIKALGGTGALGGKTPGSVKDGVAALQPSPPTPPPSNGREFQFAGGGFDENQIKALSGTIGGKESGGSREIVAVSPSGRGRSGESEANPGSNCSRVPDEEKCSEPIRAGRFCKWNGTECVPKDATDESGGGFSRERLKCIGDGNEWIETENKCKKKEAKPEDKKEDKKKDEDKYKQIRELCITLGGTLDGSENNQCKVEGIYGAFDDATKLANVFQERKNCVGEWEWDGNNNKCKEKKEPPPPPPVEPPVGTADEALQAQINNLEDIVASLQQQLAAAQNNNNSAQINALSEQISRLVSEMNSLRGQAGQQPIVVNITAPPAPAPAPTPATVAVAAPGAAPAASPAPATPSPTPAPSAPASDDVISISTGSAKAPAADKSKAKTTATNAQKAAGTGTGAAAAGGAAAGTQAKAATPSNGTGAAAASNGSSGAARVHGAFIQGQTGPGILLYPILIGASNGIYYMLKRRKRLK